MGSRNLELSIYVDGQSSLPRSEIVSGGDAKQNQGRGRRGSLQTGTNLFKDKYHPSLLTSFRRGNNCRDSRAEAKKLWDRIISLNISCLPPSLPLSSAVAAALPALARAQTLPFPRTKHSRRKRPSRSISEKWIHMHTA